jgi:hypothetical protein
MNRIRTVLRGLATLPAICACAAALAASGDVTTQGFDGYRTGAQLQETVLHAGNVGPATFGRLGSLAVDDYVHGQPLVVNALPLVGGEAIDVLYVATGSNSVFAFDVTEGRNRLLWVRKLGVSPGERDRRDIGVLSTPVIERESGTLFVVTGMIESGAGRYRLHALDLRDGSDRQGGPVLIAGSVRIDEQDIAFEPTDRRIAVQRAALALAGGKVVVAFGGDFFEGWVFAYDAGNLRQPPAAFCTTCVSRVTAISKVDYLSPECTFLGPGGGIWQSGRGPVVDDGGRVWFFTGNKAHIVKQGCMIPPGDNACARCALPGGCACEGIGEEKVCRGPDTCSANASRDRRALDLHDALIALDPAHGLAVEAWFRPENWDDAGVHGLEFNDLDLGGSGPLLIPGTSRLVGGGKEGVLYLFDTAAQGLAPMQSFAVAGMPNPPLQYYRHLLGGPVLWHRPPNGDGSRLYVWRMNDTLRSYRVGDRFADCDRQDVAPTATDNCHCIAASTERIDHHPGGLLSFSANGTDAGSAIVWAYTSRVGHGPGKLMAFAALPDAQAPDRLRELWDSDTCAGDAIDAGSTFAPPTVSNGRVYVATGANRVDVFGLLPARECAGATAPAVSEHLINF